MAQSQSNKSRFRKFIDPKHRTRSETKMMNDYIKVCMQAGTSRQYAETNYANLENTINRIMYEYNAKLFDRLSYWFEKVYKESVLEWWSRYTPKHTIKGGVPFIEATKFSQKIEYKGVKMYYHLYSHFSSDNYLVNKDLNIDKWAVRKSKHPEDAPDGEWLWNSSSLADAHKYTRPYIINHISKYESTTQYWGSPYHWKYSGILNHNYHKINGYAIDEFLGASTVSHKATSKETMSGEVFKRMEKIVKNLKI